MVESQNQPFFAQKVVCSAFSDTKVYGDRCSPFRPHFHGRCGGAQALTQPGSVLPNDVYPGHVSHPAANRLRRRYVT